MHSLFFHCDVFFDKLSKLQQISFVILYYMEKRLLISGIDFHHSSWKLYKMRKIIALHLQSDCNWTRTQNHLVLERTLNHLAKWLSVRLRTKWFWVRVQLQSLHLQILRLLQARSSLTFRQLYSVDSLWKRVRDMTGTYSLHLHFAILVKYLEGVK